MHKKHFYLSVGDNHFEFEGQIKVILVENMRHKFINSKSCKDQKSCNNLQQKYRKDVVLAAIFCFAYLKVKDTKYIILSTDSNSAHTSYVKTSGTKNVVLIADQSSMFHISIQDKYTHF